jgi:ribosomal protein S18 acetylase RimI-like enzyme
MTSEIELSRRVRRFLRAEAELFGSSAEGARLLRFEGVLASVNPAAPDRSMFNWVVADDAAALFRAYDELARAYAEAGVRAWSAWAEPDDHETARQLQALGHTLDAQPRAMAADIAELTLPDVGELDWQETTDMTVVAALNDAAYGFPPPAFRAALVRNADARWRAYVARQANESIGCVLVYESVDGDCGVSGVATLSAARGTGTASRLLTVALQQAQARGAVTTTLQATSKGAPVYARLGYRDLGSLIMWEHRVPKPQSA